MANNTAWEKYTDRLTELSKLESGWLDGFGKAIAPEILKLLEKNIPIFIKNKIPTGSIFPTEDGGISIEWVIGRKDISLEINPDKTAVFSYLHLDEKKTSIYYEIDLSLSESWDKIFDDIIKIIR